MVQVVMEGVRKGRKGADHLRLKPYPPDMAWYQSQMVPSSPLHPLLHIAVTKLPKSYYHLYKFKCIFFQLISASKGLKYLSCTVHFDKKYIKREESGTYLTRVCFIHFYHDLSAPAMSTDISQVGVALSSSF